MAFGGTIEREPERERERGATRATRASTPASTGTNSQRGRTVALALRPRRPLAEFRC
jgi:hypothetical protein